MGEDENKSDWDICCGRCSRFQRYAARSTTVDYRSKRQIYAFGTTGDGSLATPLLCDPSKTNSTGAFKLGKYTCPSPTSQVYLTATGESPGLLAGQVNPQINEMAAFRSCGDFTSTSVVGVSAITTIAAVYALAPS